MTPTTAAKNGFVEMVTTGNNFKTLGQFLNLQDAWRGLRGVCKATHQLLQSGQRILEVFKARIESPSHLTTFDELSEWDRARKKFNMHLDLQVYGFSMPPIKDRVVLEANVKSIPHFSSLRALVVAYSETCIDADLMFLLQQVAKLKSLSLPTSEHLTLQALAPVQNFKELEALDLSDWDQIDDTIWKLIGGLTELRRLSLASRKLTTLALASLQKLQCLDLPYCRNLHPDSVAQIGDLPRLTFLDLSSCGGLTDAGLAKIGRLRHLTYLNISDCTTLTDAGFASLRQLKRLKTLDLRKCLQLSAATLAVLKSALPTTQIETDS